MIKLKAVVYVATTPSRAKPAPFSMFDQSLSEIQPQPPLALGLYVAKYVKIVCIMPK